LEKSCCIASDAILAEEVNSKEHPRSLTAPAGSTVNLEDRKLYTVCSSRKTVGRLDARRLKSETSLAEFARQFTQLKPLRRELVGLCPLHDERQPSFFVDPNRQVFYCFGCGAGGDVFTFAMRLYGCDFRQSLEVVDRFLKGVARASQPRSGWRSGASEGGDSPLSSPKASVHNSQLSAESRVLLLAALDRTDRRLAAIRKANVQAAEVLATACEPWTEAETLLLENQS
jgi:hypothetical protein